MQGKLFATELRTLKHWLQTTTDELAKLASSNRALRKRVRDLEELVQKESLKHEKECEKNIKRVQDLTNTFASMEHFFKLEIKELKKGYGGLNEHVEGHEEVSSPDINEGGDNYMSPIHEYIAPTTKHAQWKHKSLVMEPNPPQPWKSKRQKWAL